MTRKTIREIISTYMHGEIPQQVKDSFETWMLDDEDFSEKNEAMRQLWDEFPEGDSAARHSLPSAQSVLEDADAGEDTRRLVRADRRHRTMLRIMSVAAAVLAVLSVSLFILSRHSAAQVCLTSSEWSKGEFYLPDSTHVFLNMGSRLYFTSGLKGRTRRVRLEGEGFFKVAKDPSRPFIVSAYDVDVTALGTEFTVSAYDPDRISAYLLEGSIEVSGPGLKQDVTLIPDQALTYDAHEDSYVRRQVNAANHTRWTAEKLEFERTSLHDICETLNHWYNVDITIEDEDFARKCRLTLTVRQEPLSEILGAIGKLASVGFSIDDTSHVVIFPLGV